MHFFFSEECQRIKIFKRSMCRKSFCQVDVIRAQCDSLPKILRNEVWRAVATHEKQETIESERTAPCVADTFMAIAASAAQVPPEPFSAAALALHFRPVGDGGPHQNFKLHLSGRKMQFLRK